MTDEGAVARSSLSEQVKDHLLRAILSGQYQPNDRIIETRVAREVGTSQAPVREALRGLEALGVVEILPFKGARVRRPTDTELLEAYEVRAELESLGARLGIPRMTDADLAEIEALYASLLEAAGRDDRHDVAVRDAAFHARILRLAGNATLERVWRALEPFSRTYITLLAPGADSGWTAGLHHDILEAVRSRDAATVEQALRDHFHDVSARLLARWSAAATQR
jgi:DNA-binding GntR family transcriptional regulator